MRVRDALLEGAAALAGLEGGAREARLLLGAAEGLDLAALLREPDRPVDAARYRAMLARRRAREPLPFITGTAEFWSLPFAVSPATLIPRADSETLIEAAVAAARAGRRFRRVLDLGTGTGCLLLAALSEFGAAWGVGVDRSAAAAALAAGNARALGLASRCALLCGDWAAPLAGTFDLVLSNPPYVERESVAGLMPEVSCFEPASALDGGPDGLDAYRAILRALPPLLAPGGVAILELGWGQAGAVGALARAAGLAPVVTRRDLGGVERALVLAAIEDSPSDESPSDDRPGGDTLGSGRPSR